MNFLTAKEAKEKADNSEQSYKILRSAIYSNIGYAANQKGIIRLKLMNLQHLS